MDRKVYTHILVEKVMNGFLVFLDYQENEGVNMSPTVIKKMIFESKCALNKFINENM